MNLDVAFALSIIYSAPHLLASQIDIILQLSSVLVMVSVQSPFGEGLSVTNVLGIVKVDKRRATMIVELTLFSVGNFLEVFTPLSFEEIKDFNFDLGRTFLSKTTCNCGGPVILGVGKLTNNRYFCLNGRVHYN